MLADCPITNSGGTVTFEEKVQATNLVLFNAAMAIGELAVFGATQRMR